MLICSENLKGVSTRDSNIYVIDWVYSNLIYLPAMVGFKFMCNLNCVKKISSGAPRTYFDQDLKIGIRAQKPPVYPLKGYRLVICGEELYLKREAGWVTDKGISRYAPTGEYFYVPELKLYIGGIQI